MVRRPSEVKVPSAVLLAESFQSPVVRSFATSDHSTRSLEKGLFTFIVTATLDPTPGAQFAIPG